MNIVVRYDFDQELIDTAEIIELNESLQILRFFIQKLKKLITFFSY